MAFYFNGPGMEKISQGQNKSQQGEKQGYSQPEFRVLLAFPDDFGRYNGQWGKDRQQIDNDFYADTG